MTADGGIDEQGLRKLMAFLGTQRIGGLWVLGTGAEDMNLTYEKRLQVARIVADSNDANVPLIMGAGFFAYEDCLNFIKDTGDLQVAGYHVMPYHPLFSLDRLAWFYESLADKCHKPMWMYTSANWCRPIPPDFVARMKGTPNIAGIKFSTSNAVHEGQVAALADESFQVAFAVVKQFYAALCVGVKAFTTSEASSLPEPIIELYELFLAGKHDQALAAQRRLNAFLADMPKGAAQDNFLKSAEAKTVLSLRGICDPYVSPYYRNLNEQEAAQVKAALQKHKMPPYNE